MHTKNIITLLALLLLPVSAYAWPGTVISVHDGDTITVAPAGDKTTPIVVRLYGVDAPEMQQPFGPESAKWLRSVLHKGSTVEIITFDTDKYGRVAALVVSDGAVVNGQAVAQGHAWVYERYCRAKKICRSWKKAQSRAREKKVGLWVDDAPVEPWVWRREAERKKSPAPSE